MADPWERIAAWCGEHAPETAAAIRPPAPTEVLNWAHGATAPSDWPDALWAFYAWCDGTERTPAGYLWPGFRPLPLLEVVETWRELMRIWFPDTTPPIDHPEDDLPRAFAQQAIDLYGADAELAALMGEPGRPCDRFLPGMLPIAEDQNGSFLVCDRRGRLRDGYGAIAVFDRDEGYTHDAPWRGLKQLAAATARALPTGRAVDGTRVHPVALGGRLTWSRAAPDPLDDPDGVTIALAPHGQSWTPLPGTDLELRADTAAEAGTDATHVQLRARRRTRPRR